MNCHIWTTGHSNVAPPLTKKNDHSLAFYFPCHVFFLFLYFSWVEVFTFVTIKWLLFTNLFILKISQANIFMKFTISFSCFLLANETYLLSLLEIWVKKKRDLKWSSNTIYQDLYYFSSSTSIKYDCCIILGLPWPKIDTI